MPSFRPFLTRLGFALLAAAVPARAAAVLEYWTFDDPVARTLDLAANSAPGRTTRAARWDVAIPGLATTGSGALRVRDAADGGPGRRTTFVNFAAEPTEGAVVLRLRLAAWDLAPSPAAGATPPRLELGFIQGNALVAAELVLEATAAGLRYGWRREGAATRWHPVILPAASAAPVELRLSLDLSSRLLVLSRIRADTTTEFAGVAALPAVVNRLTSLRWACRGDFTDGGTPAHFLDLDDLRIESGVTTEFPGLAPAPDGRPALLHAALGLDRPDISSSDAEPRLASSGPDNLSFTFLRARDDLDYLVETSPDLATWTPAALNPGAPGAQVAFALAAPPAPGRLFARLRVTVPAP